MALLTLISAQVTNFGPFADTGDVPIDPSVTVLLAENENGKTSFLRALSWFTSESPLDPDDLWDGLRDEQRAVPVDLVAMTFACDKEAEAVFKTAAIEPPDRLRIVRRSDGSYRFENGRTQAPLVSAVDTSGEVASARHRIAEMLPVVGMDPNFEPHRPQAVAFADDFQADNAEHVNRLSVYVRDNIVPYVVDDSAAELTQLAELLAEKAPNANTETTLMANLRARLPTTVFFDEQVDQLLDHVSYEEAASDPDRYRTMANLAALVGEDLLAMSSREARDLQRLSRSMTETVSKSVSDFWDGARITLHVSFVETQMLVDIEHRGRTQKPSRRSRGLAWFLGFYINFKARTNSDLKGAVLLIDEPGLFLHLKQQPMLLKLFNELARNNQIIYTTHLPEMVPATALQRLRLLVPDEKTPNTVTVVSNLNEFRSSGDVLQPVRAALGMGVAQAISLGNTNVIVEGPADPYLLGAMRDFCTGAELPSLADDVTLFRSGGAGKKMLPYIGFLVTDRAVGVVLVDDDKEGRKVEPLVTEAYGTMVPVVNVVETPGSTPSGREIEDLFSRDYYVGLVNASHEARIKGYKSIEVSELGDGPICDEVKTAFTKRKYGGFQKTYPARQLEYRLQIGEMPDDDSMQAFAALFGRLNTALQQAVDNHP